MRSALFLALATLSVSACAMLPNPSGEVSYTANPTANPNAPTTNRPVAVVPAVTTTTQQTQPTTLAIATGVMPVAQASQPATNADIIPVVNAFIVNTDPTGKEVLIPVLANTPVKKGDVLEYQGLFTNNGDRVRKMDVSLSIPDSLELIGGVVPNASGSMDGSRFVRMPVRATINGVLQDLPLSRYKALRWTVEDVGIGGTAVVKYRAKVIRLDINTPRF